MHLCFVQQLLCRNFNKTRMVVSRNFILTLSTGMFCGFFSFYLLNNTVMHQPSYTEGSSLSSLYAGHAHSHKELENAESPDYVNKHSHMDPFYTDDGRVAQELAKKVRVLCWVMTNPENHNKKAKHIKATWGSHCNTLIFMSSQEDKTLGSVALKVQEGRNQLWAKTKAAFRYLYDHHLHDHDFFLKADDDTYVIVENLRYMLSPYTPDAPIWFGCRFKKYVKKGYMSGGAGYVLSKEAVRRFVEEALPNKRKCRNDGGGAEDVEIGKCLQNVGVEVVDSRDDMGQNRFFPFVAEHHLVPGHIGPNNWLWDWIYYPMKVGFECCSDTAVSFHYIPPSKMYELEYFLYHLHPYGINRRDPFPPALPPDKSGMSEKIFSKVKQLSISQERQQFMKKLQPPLKASVPASEVASIPNINATLTLMKNNSKTENSLQSPSNIIQNDQH